MIGIAARRAYALPLVILLALVATVISAAMLRRESAQRLTIAHELRAYRDHHTSQGIREVLNAWARQSATLDLDQMIADDGHVMDLVLPEGGRVRVFMTDGQGGALKETARLSADERRDAECVLANLGVQAGGPPDPAWVRSVGPLAISVNSAPEPVLRAVVECSVESHRVSDVMRALFDARAQGVVDNAALSGALTRAGVPNEEKVKVERLLVATPTLWRVTVEVFTPGRAGRDEVLTARYQGLMTMERPAPGRSNSSFDPLGAMLAWEELPID